MLLPVFLYKFRGIIFYFFVVTSHNHTPTFTHTPGQNTGRSAGVITPKPHTHQSRTQPTTILYHRNYATHDAL